MTTSVTPASVVSSSYFQATSSTASTPTSTPPGTAEFHHFYKLPAELRIKIWNYNMPRARLVPIRCGASWTRSAEPSLSYMSGCTSDATIPANLHACSESRAEALKHYSLHFGFCRGPGQVFFNPRHDILYFGPREGYMAADSQFHTCLSMCEPSELAAVRRVTINDALFWTDNTYRSMTAARLTVELLRRIQARMPGLEEIIFVPRTDEAVDAACAGDLEPGMVYVRIARQVQTALATLCEETPEWVPPRWRILPLSSFPKSGD